MAMRKTGNKIKVETEAQRVSRIKNFAIFRLKGMISNLKELQSELDTCGVVISIGDTKYQIICLLSLVKG